MVDFLATEMVVSTFGKVLNPRASHVNPRSPACPMHLRRICGTCEHFAGVLRGGVPAACNALHVTVRPGYCAAECDRWERKRATAPRGVTVAP